MINYGLGVIMMCQCRFILDKKMDNTILMSTVDNDSDYACVGTRGMWEISVSPSSFVVNLELVYKKQYLKS